MADDLNPQTHDRGLVNVNETRKVRYWCKELGCMEPQLRDAVARVGVMADDVRRALTVSRRLELFARLAGGSVPGSRRAALLGEPRIAAGA